jgi:phosphopantothenoylcysteine decarboxylase/phosphopantothenate--cysteine ligase
MAGDALRGKVVVVGVTGGIAAYKSAQLVSTLRKAGADVYVLMSPSAAQFIGPLTLRTLSQHPVMTDMWDPGNPWEEPHVYLGERADVYVIAPATAHTIARLALGLADDVITATALATRAAVLIAPAMSDVMYGQPTVQDHLRALRSRGHRIVGPVVGWLASGKEAIGRMAEPDAIVEEIIAVLQERKA